MGWKWVDEIRRDKYQQGSIRRVKRANGFAWEFRYHVEQDGKRVSVANTSMALCTGQRRPSGRRSNPNYSS
jgi:hypothetical protein